jgi:hybrid cluster-associated redox disulfide protein
MVKKENKNVITKKMTFAEILEKKPEAAQVMMKYGMHCVGCHMARFETLEQGAKAHGMDEKQLKKLIDEINK